MSHELHLRYLQRCVELATQALEEGNDPFGSLLLSAEGEVLFEDYNHSANGNKMLHPELAIAQWAAENLNDEERATAVVYTLGEHCAMCAAAHAWVGLGKIIFERNNLLLKQIWMENITLHHVCPDHALPVTRPPEAGVQLLKIN